MALAVTGVVLGELALLCVAVMLLVLIVFACGALAGDPGGGSYYGPTRGTLARRRAVR